VDRIPVKIAAAVLAAGLAVTACGSVQMGAAAITSGQRISSATLAAEVSNLNAAYQQDRRKIQMSYTPAEMPRLVLTWLLRFRVRDELAQRSGLTVTSGDAQRALNQLAAQVKAQSPTASLAEVAVANGIPPDQLPELGRYQAAQNLLLNRLDGGVQPKNASAQQALQKQFDHQQCLAAKSLDIAVNPQYGQLDYSQIQVVSAPSTLSAVPSVKPSAAPSAQSKPSC